MATFDAPAKFIGHGLSSARIQDFVVSANEEDSLIADDGLHTLSIAIICELRGEIGSATKVKWFLAGAL
jgi:hypothetical protein